MKRGIAVSFNFVFLLFILLSFFSLLIVNSGFVSATVGDINPENTEDPLGTGINVEEVSQDPDVLQNQTINYFKQGWRKIFEKSDAGRILLGISDFFEIFNPIYKIVLGVDYSLSWSFVFAVAIWLTLFLLLLSPAMAIFDNKAFGVVGSFIITSLVGLAGVIKSAVDMLNFMISNKWIALVSFIIAVLVVFLGYAIGKVFGKKIEEAREKAAKQQTEQDREVIHTDAEVSKANLESYKK